MLAVCKTTRNDAAQQINVIVGVDASSPVDDGVRIGVAAAQREILYLEQRAGGLLQNAARRARRGRRDCHLAICRPDKVKIWLGYVYLAGGQCDRAARELRGAQVDGVLALGNRD